MSSNQNDNTIHLGNYEEFFILYMDNELDAAQKQEVEEFLELHPDLRSEFDILMSLKLPTEEYSFNKEALLSGQMKGVGADEELMLYIDEELLADRKKILELELASNNNYRLQLELLQKTKLDASETIAYPNKEELYHREVKVISIRVWMRVAVALVLVTALGLLYFLSDSTTAPAGPDLANNGQSVNTQPKDVATPPPATASSAENDGSPMNETNKGQEPKMASKSIDAPKPAQPAILREPQPENNLIARVEMPTEENNTVQELPVERRTEVIDTRSMSGSVTNTELDQQTVNNFPVTSESSIRTTDSYASAFGEEKDSDAAKGSVKGFLRKATRLIEKKTGFDPTNEDGELLIGALAVKLK
jgi:hypothetical protein